MNMMIMTEDDRQQVLSEQPKQTPKRAKLLEHIQIKTKAGDDMISIFEFLYQQRGIIVQEE